MSAPLPVTAGLALQSTIANNQTAARYRTTKTTGVLILVSDAQNLFAVDWTARRRAHAWEDSFPNKRRILRSTSTKGARDLHRGTPAVSCAAVSFCSLDNPRVRVCLPVCPTTCSRSLSHRGLHANLSCNLQTTPTLCLPRSHPVSIVSWSLSVTSHRSLCSRTLCQM